MIQHFRQAKMSLRNNLFHKSLHFSKSFKVFHCSVIKVLCFVVNRDNFLSISDVQSLVNNFFNLFIRFIAICIDLCRASRVSLVIISCVFFKVNNNFHFFRRNLKHHKILFLWCLSTAIPTPFLVILQKSHQ